MTTATERNVASAEAYYQAMHNKDLDGVARHLHPDVATTRPTCRVLMPRKNASRISSETSSARR